LRISVPITPGPPWAPFGGRRPGSGPGPRPAAAPLEGEPRRQGGFHHGEQAIQDREDHELKQDNKTIQNPLERGLNPVPEGNEPIDNDAEARHESPLHDHSPDRQEAEAGQEDGFQHGQAGGKGLGEINGMVAEGFTALYLVDW